MRINHAFLFIAAALVIGGAATTSRPAKQQTGFQLWNPIPVIEEIDINASADKIWTDLITVSCYHAWNPWITSATDENPASNGVLQLGDHVTNTVITATGSQSAQDYVTVFTPPGTPGQPQGQLAQLCWRDEIPITSCLVPAYRCRTLTENPDGSVHLTNDLVLEGVLDGLANALEGAALHKGMAGENAGVKALAEAGTLDPATCQAH